MVKLTRNSGIIAGWVMAAAAVGALGQAPTAQVPVGEDPAVQAPAVQAPTAQAPRDSNFEGQDYGDRSSRGQDSEQARPGTVNFIEGQAAIDGNPIPMDAPAGIDAGQVLSTGQGKAELLLTPGIFFRINDNSAVKMVSPLLTHTVVELDKGRAAVEVDVIYPQNEVQVMLQGKTVQLLKPGFYEFDADGGRVRTFSGKAAVLESPGRWIDVKGEHEFGVTSAGKPTSFNQHMAEDDLYKWSTLRAEYMGQASGQMGEGYSTAGWYWNPYSDGYLFWGPGPFWSPFWGWGGWYGGRFYRGGYGYHGGYGYRGGYGGRAAGGFGGGGFHGGGGGHGGGGHR